MSNVDRLLEDTVPPPHLRRRAGDRYSMAQPPEIAEMRAQVREAKGGPWAWLSKWSRSQVAGYRLELIFGYLGIMFFGWTAIQAGIPLFKLTTPDPYGWALAAGILVFAGGVIAGAGAARAGEEPVTRAVRVFNLIETVGTGLLFLVLGVYAVSLLVYGYTYGDSGRQTIGAAMSALAATRGVRMAWLIFHPAKVRKATLGNALMSAVSDKVSETGTKGDQEP